MSAGRDSPRSVAASLATMLNFPIVLVGLLLIVWRTSGDDEIALLNLWAIWGLANTLLGQIGLVTAAIDGAPWTHRTAMLRSFAFGAVAAALTGLLRYTLFPGHGWWWVAAGLIAGVVHALGRQRGAMTRAGDGATTVLVTAAENVVRVALVAAVVLAGGAAIGLGAVAITAPFVLSLILQQQRIVAGAGDPASVRRVDTRSVWPGVLAGLPGVAAYAIVPALTLLEEVRDLDAFALATSFLRGPLLVVVVASAWLLQWLREGSASIAPLAFVPLVLVGAQLFFQAVADPALVTGLIVHGLCSALALLAGYVIVLGSSEPLSDRSSTPGIAAAAALGFVVTMLVSGSSELVHPFLSLTVVSAIIAAAVLLLVPRTEFHS